MEKKKEKREKKRENRKKEREKMSRVNYYQSAFNSQKNTKYIGRNAQNFKKWLLADLYIIDHRPYKSSYRS